MTPLSGQRRKVCPKLFGCQPQFQSLAVQTAQLAAQLLRGRTAAFDVLATAPDDPALLLQLGQRAAMFFLQPLPPGLVLLVGGLLPGRQLPLQLLHLGILPAQPGFFLCEPPPLGSQRLAGLSRRFRAKRPGPLPARAVCRAAAVRPCVR